MCLVALEVRSRPSRRRRQQGRLGGEEADQPSARRRHVRLREHLPGVRVVRAEPDHPRRGTRFEAIGRNAATLLLPALALLPLALLAYKPFFHRILSLLLRRAIKQEVPERFFLGTWRLLRFISEFVGPRV